MNEDNEFNEIIKDCENMEQLLTPNMEELGLDYLNIYVNGKYYNINN